MRVIAGSARRLLLKTIEGMDTRPTTDRIKETLFNMLNTQIPGCTFLDLFSGSGAIGIEDLSRGEKQAFFVESNPEAVSCIRENLSRTHLEEGALVLNCDVIAGLKKLEGRNPRFDIIFMDPPYGKEYEKQVLHALKGSSLVDEDTLMPAVKIALNNYRHQEEMKREFSRTREALDDRKYLDRAKGMIMDQKQLSEQDAYAYLRHLSMDKGISMTELSKMLLKAYEG